MFQFVYANYYVQACERIKIRYFLLYKNKNQPNSRRSCQTIHISYLSLFRHFLSLSVFGRQNVSIHTKIANCFHHMIESYSKYLRRKRIPSILNQHHNLTKCLKRNLHIAWNLNHKKKIVFFYQNMDKVKPTDFVISFTLELVNTEIVMNHLLYWV